MTSITASHASGESLSELGVAPRLEQRQVVADRDRRGRVAEFLEIELDEQALLQRAAADPDRIELLEQGPDLLDLVDGPGLAGGRHRGELFARRFEVAALVEVADDRFADPPGAAHDRAHLELPGEVVGEMGLRRRDLLERRLVLGLVLPRAAHRFVAVFEIAEEGAVVEVFVVALGVLADGDLALGIGRRLFLLLELLRRGGGFLERGILDELLGDLLLELELRQLEQLDRLLELRRDDQLLHQPRLESLFKLGHRPPVRVAR
jgi:hypothetical protein